MTKTREDVLKVTQEALAEAKAVRAKAEAVKAELTTLKGKKADEWGRPLEGCSLGYCDGRKTLGPIGYPQLTCINYTL